MSVSICRCAFGCVSVTKWCVTGPQWAVGPLDLLKMDYLVCVCVCVCVCVLTVIYLQVPSDAFNHTVQSMMATRSLKSKFLCIGVRAHFIAFAVCITASYQSAIRHKLICTHTVIKEITYLTMSSTRGWKRIISLQLNYTSSHLYWKAMLQRIIKYFLSVCNPICLTVCNLSVCTVGP